MPTVEARHIEKLERLVDEFNEVAVCLRTSSCRAVARQPSRTCARTVVVPNATPRRRPRKRIGPTVLPYLNRLSDALFVMARYENHHRGVLNRCGGLEPDVSSVEARPMVHRLALAR